MPDFAIAGGGLLGSLLGWRLARQGYRVVVYEAAAEAAPAAAGHTAAAMIAPWAERPVCSDAVFAMGQQSLRWWPQLLDELAADSGERIAMGRSGSLLVAHPADQSELDEFGRFFQHSGLGATDAVRRLDGAGLRALEPQLASHFREGYWLPQEAHLENRPLLALLHRQIQALGGAIHYQAAVTLDGQQALVNGQPVKADCWIDTCGVGATPWTPGLRGVRGEVIWIEAADVAITRPVRLLHPRYHLYLVPKSNGRYILGATEIESADRSPVSVRSALEMLSALYALCPALAEARILEMTSNLRPALASHEPHWQRTALGVQINGLFRHGYLLAPAVLAQVQQDLQLPLGLALKPVRQDHKEMA